MSDAYKERCRCVRDLKLLIPKDIWKLADFQNPTNDNWRTACIAVEMLKNNYYKVNYGNYDYSHSGTSAGFSGSATR